eukprot:scaffold7072_cov267-Pinguiococcus_pyrenoidosus.AAC.12
MNGPVRQRQGALAIQGDVVVGPQALEALSVGKNRHAASTADALAEGAGVDVSRAILHDSLAIRDAIGTSPHIFHRNLVVSGSLDRVRVMDGPVPVDGVSPHERPLVSRSTAEHGFPQSVPAIVKPSSSVKDDLAPILWMKLQRLIGELSAPCILLRFLRIRLREVVHRSFPGSFSVALSIAPGSRVDAAVAVLTIARSIPKVLRKLSCVLLAVRGALFAEAAFHTFGPFAVVRIILTDVEDPPSVVEALLEGPDVRLVPLKRVLALSRALAVVKLAFVDPAAVSTHEGSVPMHPIFEPEADVLHPGGTPHKLPLAVALAIDEGADVHAVVEAHHSVKGTGYRHVLDGHARTRRRAARLALGLLGIQRDVLKPFERACDGERLIVGPEAFEDIPRGVDADALSAAASIGELARVHVAVRVLHRAAAVGDDRHRWRTGFAGTAPRRGKHMPADPTVLVVVRKGDDPIPGEGLPHRKRALVPISGA